MAADPVFTNVPIIGAGTLSAAVNRLDGATITNSVTVVTAGALGTKVESLSVLAVSAAANITPSTVVSLVYIFVFDGTNHHLMDTIPVSAVAASTTVAPFQASKAYANLTLPTGYTLKAGMSLAQTSGNLEVTAYGGNI